MIVKCEQCQTRFKIPDEKVTDKGVKVRCNKCGHTFRVTRDMAQPASPSQQLPSVPPADPFARFGAPVSFDHVVLYHIVFWALLPLPKFAAQGGGALGRYGLATLVATALPLLISPIGPFRGAMPRALWFEQFVLWSNIHIIMSLGMSATNPMFLRRFFEPWLQASSPARSQQAA